MSKYKIEKTEIRYNGDLLSISFKALDGSEQYTIEKPADAWFDELFKDLEIKRLIQVNRWLNDELQKSKE